ncbi:MAG: helix-turn-helix domain-containing protein [Actinomycetota bacterium]|nr:helix-turn-helix domain-containing protein [Actinomycetota bacterium]
MTDAERARLARYMTTGEVADLLRVPPETVRYWRHVGKGPKAFRIPGGRRVLYAAEDVEAFIAEARGGAA